MIHDMEIVALEGYHNPEAMQYCLRSQGTLNHKPSKLVKGMGSIISMVSISPEGFLPSILLLVVVIVTVVIVVVILVVIVVAIDGVVIVVMIIGVEVVVTIFRVVVVVGVSFIIKLSLVIIGFLHMIVFCYLIHYPLGYVNGLL
uniref:Uncharacterized protein n=1 Tax=Tanacetum cinerariifolium TaxID=118510 RepID=A0A699JLW1_TANCI|nr:hypothetical protein [Tanacetum cinerariifolium]